jgi:hypothetical protein
VSAKPGDKQVSYEGVTFDVPSTWRVHRPASAYEFECSSFRDDGVYLPPADYGSGSCPLTTEYGVTLHVFPYVGGPKPNGAAVVGGSDDVRWVQSGGSNLWYSATFPERGVGFEFYEVDSSTVEAILASVNGQRS